jgi:hypothetical protein
MLKLYWRKSGESLAFGAQMHQVKRRLKNLNFNCRWSKKIVDVSQLNQV